MNLISTHSLYVLKWIVIFKIPGLAQHKRSLDYIDRVYFKLHSESRKKYEGIVHAWTENSVILGFNRRYFEHSMFFSVLIDTYRFTDEGYIQGHKYLVSFGFDRYKFRMQHHAVDTARLYNLVEYLFPQEEPPEKPRSYRSVI